MGRKSSCAFQLLLRQNIRYQISGHISQPIIATTVAVREAFVIYSHEMQNRRMEIVDVNRLVDSANTVFIRGAVNVAAFDSRASEP